LLAGVAVCGVVVLVVMGLKGDSEGQAILEQQGVVERLKAQASTAPQKGDAVSPLVTQAQKFVLRIDPPPPPPPPVPPKPPETAQATPRPEPPRPVVVTPPRPVGVRFDLVATARYADHPELSLALLKPVAGPAKWYRQGEKMGHLDIYEIRDGSVVLYQDGKLNSEISVPAAPRGKSLLKGDTVASAGTGGPSGVTIEESGATAASASSEIESGEPTAPVAGQSARETLRRPPTRTVDAGSRIQRVVTTGSASEPSPVEKRETVTRSITSIEEIMSRTDENVSPDERQKEQEAWMQLLQVLQKEKSTLESDEAPNSDAAAEPETAQPADPNEPPTAQPSSEPGTD
jgi:hypothetical protein